MKITTWNIRHGGGSRTEAIKAVLDEVQSSDVLVITEFRPNKNADVICAHLEALGMDLTARLVRYEALHQRKILLTDTTLQTIS